MRQVKFRCNGGWYESDKKKNWIQVAKGSCPRNSLNVFSEPRPSWMLELMEVSKSCLSILLLVVNAKRNLTYTTKQGSGSSNFGYLSS